MEQKQVKTTLTRAVANDCHKSIPFGSEVIKALIAFKKGDWGNCSENDKAVNDEDPASAMGNYAVLYGSEKKLWIKRDDYGDFYRVTVLYPSDY